MTTATEALVSLKDLREAAVPARKYASEGGDPPADFVAGVYIVETATEAWGLEPLAAAHLFIRDEVAWILKTCGYVDDFMLTLLNSLKRFLEQGGRMFYEDGAWREKTDFGDRVEIPEGHLRTTSRAHGA